MGYDESKGIFEIKNASTMKGKSVTEIKNALTKHPISVGVQADQHFFQTYKSGIFDNESCGVKLDHAVTLVGYGSENGKEYYILKNSWSQKWGENGYMRIAIN